MKGVVTLFFSTLLFISCSSIATGVATEIINEPLNQSIQNDGVPTEGNIPDGIWIVGEHISPGTYSTTAGNSCYWERLKGLTGDLNATLANGLGSGK